MQEVSTQQKRRHDHAGVKRSMSLVTALACLVLMATSLSYSNILTIASPERVLMKSEQELYRQEYYNLDGNDKFKSGLLPTIYYPDLTGTVIAILVSKRQQDIDEAKVALRSLAFLQGDTDPEHPSPVLIFNEGDLPEGTFEDMIRSTERPIAFPRVDFNHFPQGFNPAKENHEFVVEGRNPWGYYQMIRFWVTTIWKHPAIQRFDAVMRLDSDSCFKEVNDYLPNFMYDGLYYHSQYVGVEPEHGANFIQGMYDFAVNWMEKTKQPVQPRNALLWHYTESSWETKKTLPVFRTNFELSKRSFMQRGDVARFHEAITEKDPFPMLRNRWGDAVLRFLLVSVFENNDRIMTVKPTGYFHKVGCSAKEVDEALAGLDGYTAPMKVEKVMEITEEVVQETISEPTEEKIPEPVKATQAEEPSPYSHLIETVV